MIEEAVELIAGREWTHPRSVIQSIPNPAVGVGFTVPTSGAVEQTLLALKLVLVTDSNAANRFVVLKFLDPDGTSFAEIASGFKNTASHTSTYLFAVGIQEFGADDAANIGVPIPEFQLDVTLKFSISVTGIQVGDQLSSVRATFSRWPVRPPLVGYP